MRNANLSNCDLSNCNLSNSKLSNTNLTNTNLSDANLTNTDLTKANLTNTDLTKANLTMTNLTNCTFFDTRLMYITYDEPPTLNTDYQYIHYVRKGLYYIVGPNLDTMTNSYNNTITCFKENTKILTNRGYIKIQDLKKGDLVKTLNNNYLPIIHIGYADIYHIASQNRIYDQLYKYDKSNYPEIFEELIMTGRHSILVDKYILDQKEKSKDILGNKYITDRKFRLPICIDNRSIIYDQEGYYHVYHVALKNNNYYGNYGIYANGLLVETCSVHYLKELSNMTLIE